jgi:SAM-dependent methyltransferase
VSREFKDHFSGHSDAYARYRPRYPRELFVALAQAAPRRVCAWDCGTGNGQAALGLAEVCERVVATDASADQIAGATPHPRIDYRVEPAERTSIASGSVSLVTSAQALHWFDIPRFYVEVRRVCEPGGVIAVWTYGLGEPQLPKNREQVVAELIDFYLNVVGPYWPPERVHIERGYSDLPFPFEPITMPAVRMSAEWTLGDLVSYLGTWSAVQRYRQARGEDPLGSLVPKLEPLWGDPDVRHPFEWPLVIRAGRV